MPFSKAMAEPTLFDRIVDGSLPSHKVAEDELWYSFLDIFPAPGRPHTGHSKAKRSTPF